MKFLCVTIALEMAKEEGITSATVKFRTMKQKLHSSYNIARPKEHALTLPKMAAETKISLLILLWRCIRPYGRHHLPRRSIKTNAIEDKGAVANFISANLFERVQQKMGTIPKAILNPPQTYGRVTGDTCLTCNCTVKLDTFLKICHGTRLFLPNKTWKVSEEEISTPITGRRVLESSRCDNCQLLIAARDKYGYDIDVTKRVRDNRNSEETEGQIAALHGESSPIAAVR